MSLLLRPDLAPCDATMLTLLSAVASASAIKKISGLPVAIKWPNDLILSEKKVGGILTEIRADIDRVSLAVIGIGINVNTDKDDFTGGIDVIATSMKEETGKRFSRNELITEILKEFDRQYSRFKTEGKAPLLQEWKALSSTIGKKVKVSIADEILYGIAEGYRRRWHAVTEVAVRNPEANQCRRCDTFEVSDNNPAKRNRCLQKKNR
jgi:BirA family transcriptional regulator, biotin operon repressor / biotin---[acetyl-CoA-carboxylase] ligase